MASTSPNLGVGGFAENDSQGFAGNYTYPNQASPKTPAVVISQITQYPGNQPPFINPTAQNGTTPTVIESQVARPGTIQNWTLDLQQQLPGKFLLDMGYVAAHGDHLQAFMHDPNQGLPANQSRGACLEVNLLNQATSPVCAGQATVQAPFVGLQRHRVAGASSLSAIQQRQRGLCNHVRSRSVSIPSMRCRCRLPSVSPTA